MNRRIGDNELAAIQASLAYVDAAREIAEYGANLRADPGRTNGR